MLLPAAPFTDAERTRFIFMIEVRGLSDKAWPADHINSFKSQERPAYTAFTGRLTVQHDAFRITVKSNEARTTCKALCHGITRRRSFECRAVVHYRIAARFLLSRKQQQILRSFRLGEVVKAQQEATSLGALVDRIFDFRLGHGALLITKELGCELSIFRRLRILECQRV